MGFWAQLEGKCLNIYRSESVWNERCREEWDASFTSVTSYLTVCRDDRTQGTCCGLTVAFGYVQYLIVVFLTRSVALGLRSVPCCGVSYQKCFVLATFSTFLWCLLPEVLRFGHVQYLAVVSLTRSVSFWLRSVSCCGASYQKCCTWATFSTLLWCLLPEVLRFGHVQYVAVVSLTRSVMIWPRSVPCCGVSYQKAKCFCVD